MNNLKNSKNTKDVGRLSAYTLQTKKTKFHHREIVKEKEAKSKESYSPSMPFVLFMKYFI